MRKFWKKFVAQFLETEETEPETYQIPKFISEQSVLQSVRGVWTIGKRKLGPEERSTLRAEAESFANSFLWKLMRNDIHYLAYLQSTAKRATDLDAVYGGAMYRDLEVLETFMEQCKGL